MAQFAQIIQVAHVPAGKSQTFQIGHILQVFQSGRLRRNLKLRNLPQVVGKDGMAGFALEDVPYCGFHGGVPEFHGFNYAADGVAQNGHRADKTVVRHADGVDLGFTQRQCHRLGVGRICYGRVIPVGGVVQGAGGGGKGHTDILTVVAGIVVGGGSGGPQSRQLGGNGGVFDVRQQRNRVQQLILLHIGFAQSHVELLGCACLNGLGQGNLRLGVIAGGLILVGKLNGNVFVLAGIVIGKIVEPGGQAAVAFDIVVAGLLQQHIPGKVPVVYKQIPSDADDQRKGQQQRHQNVHYFFHRESSILLEFHRTLYNIL